MHSADQAESPVNPGFILDMLNAHQRSSVLKAAIDLDLFRTVGEGAGDVSSIARQCSASERGIRILCDFLVINGLLVKEGARYHNSPAAALFLDSRSPASLATIAKFLNNPAMLEPFNHIAEIVRTGHTALPGQGTVEPENPVWVEFAKSMPPVMAPVAPHLCAAVLNKHTGPMRVLDIAAGHGLFGIEIAKQNPQAHITGLDWAPVLQVALENARKAGVQDRYDTLPGSAFEVEFGGPYDAVLLTNFLHHFDKETCIRLLQKVRAALRPGGCAATLEFMPNEDRVSPPIPAAFAMIMLTTTADGDAYTFSELSDMYRQARFQSVAAHPIPTSPQTIITGHA